MWKSGLAKENENGEERGNVVHESFAREVQAMASVEYSGCYTSSPIVCWVPEEEEAEEGHVTSGGVAKVTVNVIQTKPFQEDRDTHLDAAQE